MQGHIRKRVHTTKDGTQTVNWYVVIDLPRDANGKRRQKWHGGFHTRKEAEAARAKIVYEFNTGIYVEPTATTLDEWVQWHWLPTVQGRVKPSTFDSYRRNMELHVLPQLGRRQLRQLTPAVLNRLYADLMCTVDGLKAFHARRMGYRLVPDWPMTSLAPIPPDPKPVAILDGLPLDYRSLLACAWGKPSTAFGPRYATFDGPRRVPRLPGPPYHYVTRVLKLEGEPFVPKVGAAVEFLDAKEPRVDLRLLHFLAADQIFEVLAPLG